MKILVDADSCPHRAREIIMRCALRLNIKAIFAANRSIPGISGRGITMELCGPGEGAADQRLIELAAAGDLAVSRDIPLAEKLLNLNVTVINDRGREYNSENIREMLSLRNFAVDLADKGLGTERHSVYGKKETKNFADSLDRLVRKLEVRN